MKGETNPFGMRSSSGDTLGGLLQESENYSNVCITESYESIPWSEIDVEKAKLRFIYNNAGGSKAPLP